MQVPHQRNPQSVPGEPRQFVHAPQYYNAGEAASQLPFLPPDDSPSVHYLPPPPGPHVQVAHLPPYLPSAPPQPSSGPPPLSMIGSGGPVDMGAPVPLPHMHGWPPDSGLNPMLIYGEAPSLPPSISQVGQHPQHPQMQVLLPTGYRHHMPWPPPDGANGSASDVMSVQGAAPQLPGAPHQQPPLAEHLADLPASHSQGLQIPPHMMSAPMHADHYGRSLDAYSVAAAAGRPGGGRPGGADAGPSVSAPLHGGHGMGGQGAPSMRSWASALDSYYDPTGIHAGLQAWPGPPPRPGSGGSGGRMADSRRPAPPQQHRDGKGGGPGSVNDRLQKVPSGENSELDGRDGDETHGSAEQASVTRLKALLSQCPPRPEVFAAILSHLEPAAQGKAALTLPAITKLLSKLNKRGQWQHGLALFWALPALGMQADAPMANAALGACDRGKDGDSAWRIYSFMLAQDLVMDSITFKALISALAKVDHWRQCCAVFVRALDAAVALEAVSVMVLLFALVRAGRWDVAESVFLCAYEASCDTSALLAVQAPLLLPSASASGDSGDDADASALAGDMSRSSASTRRSESSAASNSTLATMSTNTSSTNSISRSGNSHESSLPESLSGPSATAGEGGSKAVLGPEENAAAAASTPLAPCPGPADLLPILMDLHSRISEAKRRSPAIDGQSTAQAPGWPNNGRGSASSAGVGAFASARAGASEGASANRALPRCRSVTSQLTVSRTNKAINRGADAAEAQHLRAVTGAPDARVERVPSSEHIPRPLPPPPPPAPLRRPSLTTQLPSFPSIPEESIPSVDVDLRHSIATATNASNSLSCLSQVSGGSAKAAEAAVAALLPAQATGGVDGSDGAVEVRAQLQDLRHAHARQGAAGAAANLSPRVVSRDALDVLRGMVEDPVARACANALLRAYARSQISETLPRAAALLAVMKRAGGNLSVDVTSINTVVSMHCDVGDVAAACGLLRQLPAYGLSPTAATYRPLFVEAPRRADGGPLALQLWQHLRRSGVSPDLDSVHGFIGAVMQLSDPGLTAAALEDCLPYLDGTAAAAAAVPGGSWPEARP